MCTARSLYTGKNHGTDHTIIGSLAGYEPDTVDTTASPEFIAQVLHGKTRHWRQLHPV
ncbi:MULTISPECIES: serine dehydratase beta chain [unclassified Eikenella]|uniref:serine dehydratase beta chain n=1 Tax=Eikenella sp. NML070372 TaxID=1795829 RepID=UPI000A8F3EB7|nr:MULTISPECIES: serine dehydratase beta chain [unclassified Eikenella]VDH00677.1 Uncharacterised protein [Helicobacter pametensis]